jgi:hypothetical protein
MLVFVVACGGAAASVEHDASTPDAADDPVACVSSPRFHELCDTLMPMQNEARRCTVGAPDQCTQTLPHELLARRLPHNGSTCPLFVNDATSEASSRFLAAVSEWSACHVCGCDLECYALESSLPCLTQSECLPSGLCRESSNNIGR